MQAGDERTDVDVATVGDVPRPWIRSFEARVKGVLGPRVGGRADRRLANVVLRARSIGGRGRGARRVDGRERCMRARSLGIRAVLLR